MRGKPLVRCSTHRTIWFHEGDRCPVCERDERIESLERQIRMMRQEARST